MNHKVPEAAARDSGQTNRITSLGTQNQVDFHEAIRVTSVCACVCVCVCVVLLASLHGDVSAFVSVLFAGQTIERLVKLATVKKDGSSLLLSSNA
jgi:hypothetical protein